MTLVAGANTIRLQRDGVGHVELDHVDVGRYSEPVYAAEQTVPLSNGGFDSGGATQTPAGWEIWAGVYGSSADTDYVEAGGLTGGFVSPSTRPGPTRSTRAAP